MTQTAILSAVLDKTATLLDGVRPEQRTQATPCQQWDVDELVKHIVRWVRVFSAGAAGGQDMPADPDSYEPQDPPAEFREAARVAVEAYAGLDDDAPVTLSMGSMPASAVASMMTGEYLAHGWDLAVATGQPIPYTDEEADEAMRGLSPLLLPEYRGEGKPFGEVVDTDPAASGLERFVAFAGRRPS